MSILVSSRLSEPILSQHLTNSLISFRFNFTFSISYPIPTSYLLQNLPASVIQHIHSPNPFSFFLLELNDFLQHNVHLCIRYFADRVNVCSTLLVHSLYILSDVSEVCSAYFGDIDILVPSSEQISLRILQTMAKHVPVNYNL